MKSRMIIFLILLLGAKLTKASENNIYVIHYISIERVLLNAGLEQGICAGDTLEVFRDEMFIGRLITEHVADKRSSAIPFNCEISDFLIGDEFRIAGKNRVLQGNDNSIKSTLDESLKLGDARRRRTGNQLISAPEQTRTWITYRTTGILGMSKESDSWIRPTLLFNSSSGNYTSSYITHSIYVRSDLNLGDHTGVAGKSLRFYHAWAGIQPDLPFSPKVKIGRISPLNGAGSGYVDGAEISISALNNLQMGILAGSMPDLELEGISSSGQKLSGYLMGNAGNITALNYRGIIGGASESVSAGLDRRWIFHQGTLAYNKWIYWSTGTELDIKAADSQGSTGSTQVTNAWTNLRFHLKRKISIGLRASSGNLIRRLETHKSIADSLWDDSQRYGVHGDVSIKLGNYRWNIGGGLRFKEDSPLIQFSGFAGMMVSQTGWFDQAGCQMRVMRNLYLDAFGLNGYASRYITPRVNASLYTGIWVYGYGDRDIEWIGRTNLEASLEWMWKENWFATCSAGMESDPHSPILITFLEISRRF